APPREVAQRLRAGEPERRREIARLVGAGEQLGHVPDPESWRIEAGRVLPERTGGAPGEVRTRGAPAARVVRRGGERPRGEGDGADEQACDHDEPLHEIL